MKKIAAVIGSIILTLAIIVFPCYCVNDLICGNMMVIPIDDPDNNPTVLALEGDHIWVSTWGGNTIKRIRISDGAIVKTIPVGDHPIGLAFDGKNIWVANHFSSNVMKIHISDWVIQTIPVANRPNRIVFDGTNIWVTNSGANIVTRIKVSDGLIKTFPVGSYPVGITFDGTNIWVVNYSSHNLTKIRVSDEFIYDPIPVGTYPIVVAYFGTYIWVTNHSDGTVTRINVSDGSKVDYSVGTRNSYPTGITFDGDNIWVANTDDHSVVKISPIDGSFMGSFPTNRPYDVIWDKNNIWISNYNNKTVTKLPVVCNQAPSVGPITAPLDPVRVGISIEASASFTDPNLLFTHTALWDWGDGSTSTGTVSETNGSGTVIGTHVYTTPGVYTLNLTVTNDDGASGSAIFQYVVIYDPDGGFITGGGWINSPPGAYTANPSLIGKATFGFVSKYQKNANVPTGQTEFQFKVANLNFHSDSYEWLVVAGAKAQYKGIGTINGEGEYKFMLSAIDADINKMDSFNVDRFRIKIWDEDTSGNENVIYDNAFGDDNDLAMTEIGGGSIVIHKQ